MKLLQVRAGKGKESFLNLATLIKIDLLKNGSIELTWPRYFHVLSLGDQGYQELSELLKMIEREKK